MNAKKFDPTLNLFDWTSNLLCRGRELSTNKEKVNSWSPIADDNNSYIFGRCNLSVQVKKNARIVCFYETASLKVSLNGIWSL